MPSWPFRRCSLLSLDNCHCAPQPTIPHLTRSSLHRCLQHHGISRLPETEGNKPQRSKFKRCPIGFFHIDIAEVRTELGATSRPTQLISSSTTRLLMHEALCQVIQHNPRNPAYCETGHPFSGEHVV
jgi:hypothetical protein